MHGVETVNRIDACTRRLTLHSRDRTFVESFRNFCICHRKEIIKFLENQVLLQAMCDHAALTRKDAIIIFFPTELFDAFLYLRHTDIRTNNAANPSVYFNRQNVARCQMPVLCQSGLRKERPARIFHGLVPIALHGILHRTDLSFIVGENIQRLCSRSAFENDRH